MIRNALQSLILRVVDPLIRLIDYRMTEQAVREYHAKEWRRYRLLQVNEADPTLANWFGRMAARHRRYCA
jgi:hypothetical protein